MSDIYEHIKKERYYQDRKWGGPAHDARHSHDDWMHYRQLREHRLAQWAKWGRLQTDISAARQQLIEIAALAVAEIEAIERAAQQADTHTEPHA